MTPRPSQKLPANASGPANRARATNSSFAPDFGSEFELGLPAGEEGD